LTTFGPLWLQPLFTGAYTPPSILPILTKQPKKWGDSPASTEQVSDPILPRLMCLQSPVLLVDSRSPQLR